MGVETTQYIRKPLYVQAVRVTKSNFDEIVAWCQGEVEQDESGDGKEHIKVRVHNPKNARQTKAFVGDWLLYTERGYKVYSNKAFHASFDLVEYEVIVPDRDAQAAIIENATTQYPYEEGDVTVLGPEIFVGKNDQGDPVISWKGENYQSQDVSPRFREALLTEDEAREDLGLATLNTEPPESVEAKKHIDIHDEFVKPEAAKTKWDHDHTTTIDHHGSEDEESIEEDEIIAPPPTPAITSPVEEREEISTSYPPKEETPVESGPSQVEINSHEGAIRPLDPPEDEEAVQKYQEPSPVMEETIRANEEAGVEVVPAKDVTDAQTEVERSHHKAHEAKPQAEKIHPSAAEGKLVLSLEEQAELGTDGVRDLLRTGEAVLVQDLAQ